MANLGLGFGLGGTVHPAVTKAKRVGRVGRSTKLYADKDTIVLETTIDKMKATNFSLGGLRWTFSTARFSRILPVDKDAMEGPSMTRTTSEFLAVKLELNPDTYLRGHYKISGRGSFTLERKKQRESMSNLMGELYLGGDIKHEFAAVFNQGRKFYLREEFVEAAAVSGHKSNYTEYPSLNFTIRLEFTIVKVECSAFPDFDFNKKVEEPSFRDNHAVVCVKKSIYHVNKVTLAQNSTYFLNAFNAEKFKEGYESMVKLGCFTPGTFVAWLGLIYPSHKELDASNVIDVLKLSHYLDSLSGLGHCERFLLIKRKSHSISTFVKLQLADIYGLHKLKADCMRRLNTKEKVDAIIEEVEKLNPDQMVQVDGELVEMLKRKREQIPTLKEMLEKRRAKKQLTGARKRHIRRA